MVGRDGVAPREEVEVNGENMEVVSSLKFSGTCFTVDRGAQQDVEKRVGEGLRNLGAVKMMFTVKECFAVNRGAQKDVEKRVGEELTTFEAVKMMFKVRSVNLGVKREVHGRVVVPTEAYEQRHYVLSCN